MNIQKNLSRISLIIPVLIASSCAQSIESVKTPTPTIPVFPTKSVVSLPSTTVLPTVIATLPPTSAMIPTLPSDEAGVELQKKLSNNGGCQLPCLWGISPGISTFQDVLQILVPLSSLSNSTYLDSPAAGSISPSYTENDLEIYTRIGFATSPDNNIINRIIFNAEAHKNKSDGYDDIFDSESFDAKISAYTLPHILSEIGIPSSVLIATYGGSLTRGSTGGFDLLLLYPDQGILVNYTTQMHIVGTNILGCPSKAHVEMELYPSGDGDTFFDRLKRTDWGTKLDYYKPLEEVTSMTTEQFYEIFRLLSDKCIETPASLWPLPEK